MNYTIHSHRYALEAIKSNDEANQTLNGLFDIIDGITDDDLIYEFEMQKLNKPSLKSLSVAINSLLKRRLVSAGWKEESPIFKGAYSTQSDWRLDFVWNNLFAVEVAFNHGSVTTANLLKPVLSSELNHIEKEVQTKFGIVITATNGMKRAGNFDGAIGTYEGYVNHLLPLRNQLVTPMLIIGLKQPETFYIDSETREAAPL